MKRTKLRDRILPDYTRGEEVFNMVTHIVGGGFGVLFLIACVLKSAIAGTAAGVVSSVIYGVCVIALFSLSSVYHGLKPGTAKKVLQVLDHCTIYFMIAGTYTPICVCALWNTDLVAAIILLVLVWGACALAVTLNAIDLKRYKIFSMICYIVMGWAVIFSISPVIASLGLSGFWWLLAGGICYTLGAILYGVGARVRYFHSIFHIFVVFGAVCHFVCIFWFVI